MPERRVIIVGGGIGGVSAAVVLAAAGIGVTLLERQGTPGGKLRQVAPDGGASGLPPMDVGPTVFTMRAVFDRIAASAGRNLDDLVTITPLDVLARHWWEGAPALDLHADIETSAAGIAAFAGPADAAAYRAFVAEAKAVHDALAQTYIHASRPGPLSLLTRGLAARGAAGLVDLWRTRPFVTLWQALGQRFRDPRLRQLFARYATYCGASPFAAPATLMLVAHVEQAGVWRVAGGMKALADALAGLAANLGATLRYDTAVARIMTEGGRAVAVETAQGERLAGDAIVFNGDVAALGDGLLGPAVRTAAPTVPRDRRSLSAVTLTMVAEVAGVPLQHHNVFFARDYAVEFRTILGARGLPADPTVYVCAPDHGSAAGAPQRLFMIVNAAADGDRPTLTEKDLDACQSAIMARLVRSGLTLRPRAIQRTTPTDFAALFPATGGALYGRASHGWMASFQRMGARSRVPGLYLAGGSVHPGPGVPMAATSGRLAAEAVIRDLASLRRSSPVATAGGISTRSAMTAPRP
jgi:1-hydroxycarotenoid 3,4-desaturase